MQKTCEKCKHWVKQPRTTPDLSLPAFGECRERVHSVPLMGQGGQLAGVIPYYPGTPENFPACGQYEERETICGGIPLEIATGDDAKKLAAMGTPIFGMP